MPQCECAVSCPFFNDEVPSRSVVTDIMKRRYCLSSKTSCARYLLRVAIGADGVPADLLPNQMERAKRLMTAMA